MSFQKCPVCDGRGKVFDPFPRRKTYTTTCTTCQGTKIINEITGLPPVYDTSNNTVSVLPENLTDIMQSEPDRTIVYQSSGKQF